MIEGKDTEVVSGTNYFRDWSGNNNHASPISSPWTKAETVFSYLPNE